MRAIFRHSTVLLVLILGLIATACKPEKSEELPNILWITSEDNSAYYLSSYGNSFATTPNLDKLSEEGFLYTRAYATSPVCHPARNSIITGVYAASNGNENMNSNFPTSDLIGTYAEVLRESGYYCTNNSKTAYCSGSISKEIWDESSGRAHYLNRPEGKNFLARKLHLVVSVREVYIHEPCCLFGTPSTLGLYYRTQAYHSVCPIHGIYHVKRSLG